MIIIISSAYLSFKTVLQYIQCVQESLSNLLVFKAVTSAQRALLKMPVLER
uniref:Uncharacterized protein n=1 Tax=Anguilla anguilla TaxID=7936 RepID=A0A0E9VTE0_ANGAN